MVDLLVLCPSRGRPDKGKDAVNSFLDTKHAASAMLLLLDEDDPTWKDYPTWWAWVQPAPGSMNAALRKAVETPGLLSDAKVIGFVGDDHRFRTHGWDREILDLLAEHPGVAYGNDMLQGEALPTNWFVSRPIVDKLNMSLLPDAKHLYLDDAWKTLASAAGCLYYMPDILVEHMHFTAGKSEHDAGYQRVNAPAVYEHDAAAYHRWLEDGFERDLAILRRVVG